MTDESISAKSEGTTIEITSIDEDWDYRVSGPVEDVSADASIYGSNLKYLEGPRLNYIQFNPGSTGTDKLTIKEKDENGIIIFYCDCESVKNQKRAYYSGVRHLPYIDYSECTLSSGHSVIIGEL